MMTLLLIRIYDHGHSVAIADIDPLDTHIHTHTQTPLHAEVLTTSKQPVAVCKDVSNGF